MFKLVGPVLIPQDLIEAKANVKKRLEYMQGETCVFHPDPTPLSHTSPGHQFGTEHVVVQR